MVKIKIKTLFIGLILLVALMPIALANSMLEINKLKAYVDGDSDTGTIDANPESEVEMKFEIENIFDKTTGLEITDIEVTSYISKIDDGDDLEPDEDPDVDDLDPGKDDSVEIVFEIPLEVDDDSYDLEIKVEGKDTNGTTHTATASKTVRIKKEKHDVVIRRAELYNAKMKCGRSTQLSVSLINMGTSDEDDVVLTVTNEDLGLSKRETFDLDKDPFDSDSKHSNTFTVSVPKEQEADTYPINVKVSYDDGGKITEKNVDLEVECEKEEITAVVQEPTVTEPTVTEPTTTDVVVAQEEQGALASLQSVVGNKGLFALILLVELAIIIVGVVLVVSWVKKK